MPRRAWSRAGLVVAVVGLITASVLIYQHFVLAVSATKTLTAQADWEAGEYYANTLDTTTTANALQIKAGGVGTWDSSTPAFPEDARGSFNLASQVPSYGADLTNDGSYIYMITGNNLPLFWRYNPNTNTWRQLADAPTSFYYNAAITYYNGKIYAINGHDGTVTTDATGEFWQYDIATDTWSALPDAPDAWGAVSGVGGSDIRSGNNGKIYAVQGNGQTGFWAYDTVAGSWSILAPVPDPISNANSHPLAFSAKSFTVAGITYCTSGCLYTFVSARSFYRYDIANEQWYTSFADIPSALGSVALGSAIVEDTTNNIFYAFRGGNTEFMKYTIGDVGELVTGTWDAATDTTENTQQRNVTQGASLTYIRLNGVGYVYGLLGGSQPEFMRYDTSVPKWDMVWSLVSASATNPSNNLIVYVPSGTDCSDSSSGCLFVIPANTTSATVRRFNIQTRTWTASSGVVNTGAGATSCYDGNGTIFVARGANTLNVYNYNISDGTVASVDLPSGRAAGAGADLACTGVDNTAYLLHGNSGVLFSRLVTTTWSTMQTFTGSTPALPYLNVNYGASLTTDGTDMYALIGNGRGVFLKYTVGSNNWSELASLPTNTGTSGQTYTSVINYDGVGNIYAMPGHYQKDMWRYDISAGTWSRAADVPVRTARAMGLTKGNAGGAMYALRGEGWYSIYKFTPTDNNYIPSATWVSVPIDMDFVGDFTTFAATHPTPGTSSVSFSIRSSINKVDWSTWEDIVSGANGESTSFDMASVTTPNRRYVQVKVVLTSDGANTPTLSDFTITYEKDSTAPANPTVAAYSNSSKTTPLSDSGSYYYTNPYFEFTPAVQTESPIAGYYAAWTSDPNFDPSDTGSYGEDYYQTGSTYLVRRPMTRSGAGTIWYLRIAIKDQAGNVASPETKFQYTYTGINNASNKQWTSQAEFSASGTTLSNVEATSSPGNVKLSAISNGAWTNEASLPFGAGAGSSIIYSPVDNLIYVLQGASRNMRSYNPNTKIYSAALGTYPVGNVGTGSSMVIVAPNGSTCIDTVGCIFATRGGTTNTFGRFNIGGSSGVNYGAGICGAGAATTAGSWTQCTNTSVTVGAGGSLTFNSSDKIYALYGNTTVNFYEYNLATDTWTQRSNVDNTVGVGGTLAYYPNGSGCSAAGGCLFATRGGANNTHFYKGTIAANGSVTWAYATNTPITFGDGASVRRVGTLLYFERGNLGNELYTYDPINDLWARKTNEPTYSYQGSEQGLAYNTTNNFLYAFRGYGETSLFAYDIANDDWDRTPALPNFYTQNGFSAGVIAYDSSAGIAYIARGGGYSDFWSYNTSTGAWTQLPDVPHTVTTGADAEYVNHSNNAYDGVYLAVGNEGLGDNITFFYRYNPSTGVWVQLSYKTAAGNIGELNAGADLVFDGTDNIYTAQGSSTAFYSYDITDNQWTNLTGASQPLLVANGSGSCAVKINVGGTNYIYLTRANNQSPPNADVIRFNLTTLQWEPLATVEDAPAALNAGDACVLDGTDDGTAKILIPQGSANTNMYVLDPDGDSNGVWTTRTVLQTYSNGNLVQGPANTILGFRGSNTSAMDRYVVATGSSGYEQNGTWTSEIIDFNGGNASGLYGYAGLQVTMTDAAHTYETVETRTCSDAGCAADANDAHWGTWTSATNQRTVSGIDYYSVASSVARYGQVRVRVTSDQVLTPTVQDVQWDYYVDSTAPNNPTVPIGGYTDSGKGTSITNDTFTNDLTPYFEWTSTDDTNGIGIDGYYVYFGTDVTKDPVSNASDPTNLAYRSGTNYYSATGLTSVGSWNAATQSASALTDGTYYLRIKTKDRNNNTTSSAVTAFTFKVDGSAPNNITDLSVATYMLATDTFSFSWTEPADVGPAGISQYCYHTGSSSDTCVARATICSGGTCTVSPVAHYQNRANTFYVRARDVANNDGASYASTNYFYTGGPPTAPQSVTVTPGSQTDTNNFTVTWTLPATCLGSTPCSASDVLRYCYTINTPPSAGTCGTNFSGNPTPSPDGGWTTDVQASSRQLASFSAATQQGANTVFIVAMDVVSNINYANYTSQTFTFTSNSPGPPADLGATDSSDRAANRYSITLTWDAPTNLGSGVEAYKVYRCTTDCENPDTVDDPPANYTNLATVSTLGYLDTSLSNTTTYSYFVRATGTGGTISGNSAVVAMKPEGKFKAAPAMSGNPTTSIRIRSAEISWLTQDDVDKNGDPVPHPASSYVQYGTTTGYGSETGSGDLVNEHDVNLTNLSPNTLYHYRLKWVDVDGNVGLSSDYTFTTLGAPSAPTAVTATPTSGTTNSFAFNWAAPADEGVTVASYRYSVNSTPTADNTTSTTSTSVPAFAAATRQGQNTFYVVAVDDGGNVNYNNYGSVDFTAYTTPPGPPRNITLVDSSDRDAKRYLLTLTWDAPIVAASAGASSRAQAIDDNTIYYTISRSTDGTTFSDIATITSTGYLDTGLDSETTYYYKVTARDKAQATSESTKLVSDKPEGRFTTPPAITKSAVVTPDSFSAVVTWSTERVASSFVDFGASASDLLEEQGTADLVIDHSVKITGLKPETTYYYQVKSLDVDENVATSEVASFTTLEAPRVLDLKISDIRLYDTIISWKTNKETTAVISYGTSANYGLTYTDTSGSYALVHTVKLESLKDSTLYHLKIGGQDRNGNPVSSDDYTFTTQTFPKVSEITTQNKSQGQTEVFWKTNVPTTSEVEYYGDAIAPKTQGNTAFVTEHSILLYGLEDAALYKFKVRGSDEYGYEAVSAEQEFTTLQDTTPPDIFGVNSESNTIGSGDASKIQIVISWKTNEPTTSQVEFGVGLSSTDFTDTTEENAELVMEHLVVISDLTPAKTYHFRVVSRDKAGNVTKSNSYTVLTSRKRESFLQLIITNLEETFSWLGNVGGAFGGR